MNVHFSLFLVRCECGLSFYVNENVQVQVSGAAIDNASMRGRE